MALSSSEQMRRWSGPALLSYGFRPFFLFGALWAALAMPVWIAALSGALELPSRFDPVTWHAHEFLFGYLGAILAGFLLTAVPNWTGRLPLVGWRLGGLFALWVAGRVAVLFSASLPLGSAAAVDLAFPIVLGGVILREIISGQNWRNLIVLAMLAVFTLANGVFHLKALVDGFAAQGLGLRLGLATAVMMIVVIGGRIVPSFTRNWLVKQGSDVRPAPPMQRFDKFALLTTVAVLLLWSFQPEKAVVGVLLLGLAVLHVARLWRWKGTHTLAEPLLSVLHASYALIPLGALALGASILGAGAGQAAAQHIWMAGAIGAMTLAVMTRATLGHTGRALKADGPTLAIYLSLFGSVVARWLAGEVSVFLEISAVLWVAAFGGFALCYGAALVRPKPPKEG
ncbi:NnrS family protein [Shimia sp. R9_3]|uniref:NnrS family protein n=1 Tax=Shimia sp. R9_3 TaxID=2821113 RepID=UPI001ADC6DE1|nr:NnrS family protein [Shimia sp. R9_3]MBO9400165.1 NnrS family protein [Shimia sp. R9_3]